VPSPSLSGSSWSPPAGRCTRSPAARGRNPGTVRQFGQFAGSVRADWGRAFHLDAPFGPFGHSLKNCPDWRTVQTAYAELLEQLTTIDAARAIGQPGGSFVRKQVKGQEYYYYQHALPGGVVQHYVGRRTAVLDRVVARFAAGRAAAIVERRRTEQLVAILRAGGALTVDAPSGRVLAALADAAVFRLGGVLVGTNAYVVLGNVLGVRWPAAGLRTDDIDVASPRALAVAVPPLAVDVPGPLESLEMGFFPVPGLSPRHASTAFKVRGRGLRVDVLTPRRRGEHAPVLIPRLGTAAQPLPYLDYLLEATELAAVVAGAGVLVNVPAPARFALHKLIVARARPAATQGKSEKDLVQAARVITILASDRPGDLHMAWEALRRRHWERVIGPGLTALERRHPDAFQALAGEIR